jgi:hypothetical protein
VRREKVPDFAYRIMLDSIRGDSLEIKRAGDFFLEKARIMGGSADYGNLAA